jgi:uncharacterized membrane protein
MGETVEIIISILFFGGLFLLDSWAWGRVGHKLGYSFWAFALTLWAIVLAIISILLLGLLIRVGNETLELIIGVSYYGGFFLLCGWIWGLLIWGPAFIFLLVPITLFLPAISILYLGFRRTGPKASMDFPSETSPSDSS